MSTVDGPKNACSAKWCEVCANREKRQKESNQETPISEGDKEMGLFGGGNGKHVKVKTNSGKSLPDGRVSFKSGAKPGPAGSGQARNDRLSARYGRGSDK